MCSKKSRPETSTQRFANNIREALLEIKQVQLHVYIYLFLFRVFVFVNVSCVYACSLSLSLYIYIYMCVCVYIYIYIYIMYITFLRQTCVRTGVGGCGGPPCMFVCVRQSNAMPCMYIFTHVYCGSRSVS
jgi:hypothetical protein